MFGKDSLLEPSHSSCVQYIIYCIVCILYENSRHYYSACMFFGLEDFRFLPVTSPAYTFFFRRSNIYSTSFVVHFFLSLSVNSFCSDHRAWTNSSCVLPFSFFVTRPYTRIRCKTTCSRFPIRNYIDARVYVINVECCSRRCGPTAGRALWDLVKVKNKSRDYCLCWVDGAVLVGHRLTV